MKNEDMQLPDVQALVRFGKLGVAMMGARILSIVALIGVLALAGYVAFSPSWQGTVCVGILAFFVFTPALRSESRRTKPEGE